MLAEAYEAQRVARNYAKAAKRSLKAVQALQQACPGPKKIFWLIFFKGCISQTLLFFKGAPSARETFPCVQIELGLRWHCCFLPCQEMVGNANSEAVTALFNQKLTGGAAPPKLQSAGIGSKAMQTKFGEAEFAGSEARPIGAFSVRTVTVGPDEDGDATWVEEATTLVPETCVEHPATEVPDDDIEEFFQFLIEDDGATCVRHDEDGGGLLDEGIEPESNEQLVEFPSEWDADHADGLVAKRPRTK